MIQGGFGLQLRSFVTTAQPKSSLKKPAKALAERVVKDGREIVFSTIPEGSYLGELMTLDGAARSLCVFARTPARLDNTPATAFPA